MEPASSYLYYNLIILGVSLILCAIFSFLETSVTALRLFKLKEVSKTTDKYRALFDALENNPHRILITILIANNLANVTAATASSGIMEFLSATFNLSEGLAFSLGIGLTTAAILVFGEVIPKNIAKVYGEKMFPSTLWFINIIFWALYPIVNVLVKFANLIVRLIGQKTSPEGSEFVTSEKEIQFLIDYINQKGLLDHQKTLMLKSIFELSNTQIKDIMVPETSIVSIGTDKSLQDALNLFSLYQFSRIPVFDGEPDNIIGMLHQKDLFLILSKNQDKLLKDIVRPIIFVPESVKVLQLLKEFREQRMHIAMVVDEHGSMCGLVTLEDVLEEIVGEITDEYESVAEKIMPLKPGAWLVDGSIELDDLEHVLKIEFETEDAITLSGFLTEQIQRLPKKGEHIFYKNFHFQIQQASPKRVFQVLIFQDSLKDQV